MNWELLLKYVNKETNLSESRMVEAWVEQQAENRLLLSYLQKRKKQLEQPLKQSDMHQQWVLLLDRIFTQQQLVNTPSKKGTGFMGVAAASLLMLTIGWFFTCR